MENNEAIIILENLYRYLETDNILKDGKIPKDVFKALKIAIDSLTNR